MKVDTETGWRGGDVSEAKLRMYHVRVQNSADELFT